MGIPASPRPAVADCVRLYVLYSKEREFGSTVVAAGSNTDGEWDTQKIAAKKPSGGAIWRLRGILLPFMEVFSPILHKHFTATGGSVLNPPSRVSFSAAAQDG